MRTSKEITVPEIDGRESFDALVRKLSVYVFAQWGNTFMTSAKDALVDSLSSTLTLLTPSKT